MAQEHVVSREYKLMLRAHLFTGAEDALLRKAGAFWGALTQAIRDVVLDTDGDLDTITKRRFIRFYDTQGQRLRKNDYIFRGRCFTVVDLVVDGDLQCCAMAEEHAHHLCFSSSEQLNNSGTPSHIP
jgi:hypothetical protein